MKIILYFFQLIFIGDEKQMCPTVFCQAARRSGLSKSLFQRLILNNNHVLRPPIITLNIQYRMWPGLYRWSNDLFYNGIVKPGITEGTYYLLKA